MASWPIFQITTFAGKPFEGNPAIVLLADRSVPVALANNIRTQLNESVLTLVWREDDHLQAEFVTAAGVHLGPGHSTHAAAWVALNRLPGGPRPVEFRLRNGATRAFRMEDGLVAVDWPAMEFFGTDEGGDLARVFGEAPVETYTAEFGTIAVMADERAVREMAPDLDAMTELQASTLIVTARSQSADFAVRVFAPKLGMPEDPVCGTAHRILTPFWADRIGRDSLVSQQLSPRGGRLYCRRAGQTVTIAGQAIPFMEGVIEVPA